MRLVYLSGHVDVGFIIGDEVGMLCHLGFKLMRLLSGIELAKQIKDMHMIVCNPRVRYFTDFTPAWITIRLEMVS